jgi:hypothetical protein
MDFMLIADKSSDVRQNWSEFMDSVIHKSPKFVQRNERDVFMAMNFEYLSAMLYDVRYSVEVEHDQEAGEYVATMNEFWFVEAGESEEEAIHKLAQQLLDYAQDYYKELDMHFHAPNLKTQFPKVIKALITNDVEGIKRFFDVQHV